MPARLIVEHFGLQSSFNPLFGSFEIGLGGKSVLFLLATHEAYMGNRAALLKETVSLEGGDVILPADAVDLVIRYFFNKRLRWSYESGVFSVRGPGAPAPRPGVPSPRPRPPSGGARQNDVLAVVIDPGHGGKDPGGVGYDGIKEKDVVLAVALEVQRELKRKLGSREVVITRDRDVFLTLEERSEAANVLAPEKNAIFVSIHANVSLDLKARGFESYFLSLDSYDETAREVASMENSVLSFEMENYSAQLKDIINRIVDVEYRRESYVLAGNIQSKLSAAVGRESVNRSVKSAFFYVLKAVKMPSVLVEIGFVTNREEAKKLLLPEYRKKLAKGIAEGVADFATTFRRTEGFTKQ